MKDKNKEEFVKYMYEVIRSGELPKNAALLAYSFILSFVPLIIILISFSGHLALPSKEVYEILKFILPEDAYEIVLDVTDEVLTSSALGKISFIPLIYFTSHATRAVIRTTDSVYTEGKRRGGIKLYVISVMYAMVLLLALCFLLSSVVFGDILIEYFFSLFSLPEGGMIMRWVSILRFVFAFFILWGFLCMVYAASPNVRLVFSDVYYGALFSSVGWIIISAGFSFYVNNFSSYGLLFGSLGGIFILLVWLYISSYIMLLGVYINRGVCKDDKR